MSAWISDLAPTSMPRVGSSMISTRGLAASHLASTTFCWFPPESCRTNCSGPRVRMPNWPMASTARFFSATRSITLPGAMRSSTAMETFSRTVIGRTRPCVPRSSGT